METIRVGIIDIGSNSIKLLISEWSTTDAIRQVHFAIEEVRIGEGMTESPPIIDSNAIKTGTQAVSRLHSIASQYDLHQFSIVATSAVRDAHNRHEFVDSIRLATGTELRTLSGQEEANLIGRGIIQDPALNSLDRFTLADLGGGSLECIQFKDQTPVASQSFNLGAVRLASQYITDRNEPVSSSQRESIESAVKSALQSSSIQTDSEIRTAVLTGGAASIIVQLASDPECIQQIELVAARSLCDQVCSMDYNDRVSKLGIPAKRADIFPVATIILCELIDYLGCDSIYFSFYNLRFGLAAEMIEIHRSANP